WVVPHRALVGRRGFPWDIRSAPACNRYRQGTLTASPRSTGGGPPGVSWHPRVAEIRPPSPDTFVRVAKGWEDRDCDEPLSQGAADYYERGRLPNSPTLADAFESALGLNGT